MSGTRDAVVQAFIQSGRAESRLAFRFRAAVATALGITPSDVEGLEFLLEHGSATAGRLARETDLTTGAITSMIRRLESGGFLESQRDQRDRRQVLLTPVRDRQPRGMQLYSPFADEMERLVEGYSTDQLEFLVAHQERMSEVYTAQLERLSEGR